MKQIKRLVSTALAVLMVATCASAVFMSANAASNEELNSQYATNAVGVGQRKTITIDGDISDWDSSMLIAQGAANDDPRVYRDNSMYEIPYDDYALYACWDDSNLYLMWEMTNVQDVVAPNDEYPLNTDDRFVWQQNTPVFIAIDTDPSLGGNGTLVNGSTLWDCNITYSTNVDRLIAFSTRIYNGKNVNGPFIYTANSDGLFETDTALQVSGDNTGINMANGTGIISEHVYGINGAYGHYNNRLVGDMCGDDADWVDFNTLNHDSDKNDYHYEISIPLAQLGITSSYIETNGIGVCKVQTAGASGMDCLPYDVTMNDSADLPDTRSQENNSFEKSDEDYITTSFARVGNMGTGTVVKPTTEPETTEAEVSEPETSEPETSNPETSNPETSQPESSEPETTPQTSLEEYVILIGDADLNGYISIDDATEIQRYLALYYDLSDDALIAAECNANGFVEIDDVTEIQRYLAQLSTDADIIGTFVKVTRPAELPPTEPIIDYETQPVTEPATEPGGEDVSGNYIYFRNTSGWSVPYAYYWSGTNTAMTSWPGEAMTNVSEDVYVIEVPEDATKIIFNPGGDNGKTGDLDIPGMNQIYEDGVWSPYTE